MSDIKLDIVDGSLVFTSGKEKELVFKNIEELLAYFSEVDRILTECQTRIEHLEAKLKSRERLIRSLRKQLG